MAGVSPMLSSATYLSVLIAELRRAHHADRIDAVRLVMHFDACTFGANFAAQLQDDASCSFLCCVQHEESFLACVFDVGHRQLMYQDGWSSSVTVRF